MHQYAPTNTQSQPGLKSNDYNIPAGGRYKKMDVSLKIWFLVQEGIKVFAGRFNSKYDLVMPAF